MDNKNYCTVCNSNRFANVHKIDLATLPLPKHTDSMIIGAELILTNNDKLDRQIDLISTGRLEYTNECLSNLKTYIGYIDPDAETSVEWTSPNTWQYNISQIIDDLRQTEQIIEPCTIDTKVDLDKFRSNLIRSKPSNQEFIISQNNILNYSVSPKKIIELIYTSNE